MAKILIIPGRLPGLNEYISAERASRYKAAQMKRKAEELVIACAKKQLRGFRPERVFMRYLWVEKNRRRDLDNISSYGRKVIQDSLVKAGMLKNDGWENIMGFSDSFTVDKMSPRIEIEIIEVEGDKNGSNKELENKDILHSI